MKTLKKYFTICIVASFSLFVSCESILDEKSDYKLAIPETLGEFQALLDRYTDILGEYNASGEVSSDDYYLTDNDFNALRNEEDKRLYTWQSSFVATNSGIGNDWLRTFKPIYVANAVLHEIKQKKILGADYIKGQALTIRASRYLDALQVWAPVYNKSTSHTDLGLPLRNDPDMNLPSIRASVEDTYNFIINDLNEALEVLPELETSIVRPNRGLVNGLLARAYLYRGQYSEALEYALKGLEFKSNLIDFNSLNSLDKYPIKDLNIEQFYRVTMRLAPQLNAPIARIPKDLYDLYHEDDLRKEMFFTPHTDGTILFRGTYSGSASARITSITSGELYLVAAECYARLNQVNQSVNMLNLLLKNRWKSGRYIEIANGNNILDLVLIERRKELLMRGLRWPDIKRLNRDGASINLTRIVNGIKYTLPANDKRFAISIPEEIIDLTGMIQN